MGKAEERGANAVQMATGVALGGLLALGAAAAAWAAEFTAGLAVSAEGSAARAGTARLRLSARASSRALRVLVFCFMFGFLSRPGLAAGRACGVPS